MNNLKKVYFITTNHRTAIGIGQQIDVIKRIFKKLKNYQLIDSNYFVPNQINLFIEENNKSLLKLMKRMKKDYPETKFILFISEYLTDSIFGKQLNTFELKTKISHVYINLIEKINTLGIFEIDNINGLFFNKAKEIKYNIRKFINNLLLFPLTFLDKDGIINSLELSRREYCLKKSRFLYDLVISNCEAVNKTYVNFFKSDVSLVPTYINKNKAIRARERIEKKYKKRFYPGLFFSGRISSYRRKVLHELFSQGTSYPSTPHIKYFTRIDDMLKDKKQKRIPIFELYIKQEKKWLYSSPMRTLLSIEKGYIPINLGTFKDHDINKISIQLKNNIQPNELSFFIQTLDIKNEIKKLNISIDKHNKKQDLILNEFSKSLDNL